MNHRTLLGISAGTILGLGGVATDFGNIPFMIFLSMGGVRDPKACLEWMKDSTKPFILHPCFPISDPTSLGIVSNFLVFIAIVLIVWKLIEFLGKLRNP